MDSFTNPFSGAKTPAEKKDIIMNELRNQAALQNARALLERLNDHCFEKCIPKPGSSISSSEDTCLKKCMEKYMAAWNAVSRQYIARIQKEGATGGVAL